MLKAVIFDLDDTLLWDEKSIKEAFKSTCQIATKKYRINAEQLEERVRYHAEQIYPSLPTFSFTKNIGIGTFEGFWGTFSDDTKEFKLLRDTVPKYREQAWAYGLRDVGIEDESLAKELAVIFPQERKKHIYLYEETLTVLNKLKDTYKLIMLTNGAPSLQHTKLSLSPELAPYFDHIIISGDFGEGKPSVELFKYMMQKANIHKDEAVMIGDNPNTDILGALRVGMDSIWINHHNKKLVDIVPTYEVSRLKEVLPIISSLTNK